MKTETYKTKKGTLRYRPVLTSKEYLKCENDYIGFCVACGSERDSCEPDAARYTCDSCGEKYVYGVPELLIMGIARITE